MSSYKKPKNKRKIQLEDEIIPDWKYFTGQQNYWGAARHNKNIRIPKVKVFLKNVSSSFAYRQYIKQITYPFSITRCKNCMGCLRTKLCLRCYTCKHLDTKSCSKLICFTNPSNEVLVDLPLGMCP